MDVILLSVGVLVLLGVAGWLVWDRSKMAKRLAEADAERRVLETGRTQAEESAAAERARLEGLVESRESEIEELRGSLEAARIELGKLESSVAEREKAVEAERGRLNDDFKKLAERSLAFQRERFGEDVVKPVDQKLVETQEKLIALSERLDNAARAHQELRAETGKLARALSRPEVRGRYGEIQLRRVAELAGMTNYCAPHPYPLTTLPTPTP